MKNKMTSPKSLRCDEVFAPQTPPLIPNTDNNLNQDLLRQQQEQFCKAYRDGAILNDARVVANMLHLENFYKADMETSYSAHKQNEIKPHMRKIVAEWMLEVTEDQRCHVDVFLLAINIMDRFLATISLQKKQFQLLGAASIFIASKMLEPSPIAAVTLIKYTADTYDREELLVSDFTLHNNPNMYGNANLSRRASASALCIRSFIILYTLYCTHYIAFHQSSFFLPTNLSL